MTDFNEKDIKLVKGSERIFPSQTFNSYLYKDKEESFDEALFGFLLKNLNTPFHQSEFRTSNLHSLDEMASSPSAIEFLRFIISITKPKLLIEIGTFVGFSTVNLIEAAGENVRYIAIEKFKQFHDLCKANLQEFGFSEKVELYNGDAKVILPNLDFKSQKLGFAFIDGNKEDYLDYIRFLTGFLDDDGVIVVDDCFFHGDVFNKKANTLKGKGLQNVVSFLAKEKSLTSTYCPIFNGMLLIKKAAG